MISDIPELAFWAALALLMLVARHRFEKANENRVWHWDTSAEEAKEAAEFAAYKNRHNESHLRLVKGDTVREYTPYDQQAFALDATSHFGFYPASREPNNAA
jgi:hypothetical protein